MPEAYPPIYNHGLIGDLQTAALVTNDGEIDWYCCPRFDSPSVFGSLLDRRRGGRFQIRPIGEYDAKQLYLPDSAILITRFMSEDGVGELMDFMPVIDGRSATHRHRIVRIVRVVRGKMTFQYLCEPRFDYARAAHELELGAEGGAVFRSPDLVLTLHTGLPLEPAGDDVRGECTITPELPRGMILESAASRPPSQLNPREVLSLLEQTGLYWRRWLDRATYQGRWRELVTRSAMTLRLLTYAPSGALVAAPTTGLPEQCGGERNWDYRFAWIRDNAFSLSALLGLGYLDEAQAFLAWLQDRLRDQAGDASGPLKVMYRVDGSADLEEETLDHLEGYDGSRPVRIGNGAADQLQLDIYGEALNCLAYADRFGYRIGHEDWQSVRSVIDWLCEHWDQPDDGIWETRGGRKNFVYGRMMCWVALDRAIRLAVEYGRPADIPRWRMERDQIYSQIMTRGYDPRLEAFVQHYGSSVVDAANLAMPSVHFIYPRDPMWLSTMDAMQREIITDSLVYRYDPAASPDGLRGDEGTFSLCTFWYVEALARSGRLELARLVFEKMLTYANPLFLYSEEISTTGKQLGNFPQAFTHLALINAALILNRELDRRKDSGKALADLRAEAMSQLHGLLDGREAELRGDPDG